MRFRLSMYCLCCVVSFHGIIFGFRNHLWAELIDNLTRRADMSRRVIPAREALRIGFRNDLRAELITRRADNDRRVIPAMQQSSPFARFTNDL